MTDIFISYAREDRETAKTLAQALTDQGWSVWWDRRIRTGGRFYDVIDRELTAARCVIALWSKAALMSSWVREEAQDGLDRDILVPARIEMVRLPIGFRTIQTADLSAWAGDPAHPGFAQLLEDITAALDEAPPSGQIPEPEAKPEKPTRKAAEPNVKKVGDPRHLPDLAVFRDVDALWCPEMVVLPVGKFLMGSPENEEGRSDREGPQHLVTIGRRFAIGRYAVTFAEYDYFCEVKNREKPSDNRWGRDRRPVINVNWNEAENYVEWLAEKTGKAYRLPSEAEWEYACRAGTETTYSFGMMIDTDKANYHGREGDLGGSRSIFRGQTVPVDTFKENNWHLFQMHGNVCEWVQDVMHSDYHGVPSDGSAVELSNPMRVLRGGSWGANSCGIRSAARTCQRPGYHSEYYGFRVAQTLD